MNVSKVSKLTDEQIINLYRNPGITNDVKTMLLIEIKFRELKALKSYKPKTKVNLSKNEILLLLCFPFFYRFYRKEMFKKSWSPKRDKQFWNYITIGIGIYSILFLLFLCFQNH